MYNPAAGGSPTSTAVPEGYERYTGLGDSCKAAYVKNAQSSLQPLAFIPCPSGSSGCEQVVTDWYGQSIVSETGSDGFEFQVALDANGNATKLMQLYLPTDSASSVRASVHDLVSLQPVAAWVNLNTRAYSGCRVRPVIANDTAWLVAKPADGSGLKVAHGPLSNLSAAAAFISIPAADDTVWEGKMVASDQVLALEQSDGKLFVIYAADDRQLAGYGPNMRVWLHSAIGSDVIVYNNQDSANTQYFRLSPDGRYTNYPIMGHPLTLDGVVAAWTVNNGSAIEVWDAPYVSQDPEGAGTASRVTVLNAIKVVDLRDLSEPLLTNGQFAVAARTSYSAPPLAYSVDVRSARIRSAELLPPSIALDTAQLQIVSEEFVWFSFPRMFQDQYYTLQRKRWQ